MSPHKRLNVCVFWFDVRVASDGIVLKLFERLVLKDCSTGSLVGVAAISDSSSGIEGAYALRSLVQAMLLLRPGTDELILFPSRRRTFRSRCFVGDATYWRGKVGSAGRPCSAANGQFSFGEFEPVVLNRGCRIGRTGESNKSRDLIEATLL